MKLDRNINPDGKGKYALIKLRVASPPFGINPYYAHVPLDAIDYGEGDNDFFVIRLKDKYASEALATYASKAREDGQTEYAAEIMELALKAKHHPCQKRPD